MSYTSFPFLVFLALGVILYRLCPIRSRPALLLVLSYLFYVSWTPIAAVLMAVLTLTAFFAGRVSRPGGRLALPVAALLISCLAAFKIALLTPSHGLAGLVLPLGISYYTFKLVSYVIDIHWGKIEPEPDLVRFAAYVSFFPQIVAGPIQRPGDFFSQLPSDPAPVSAILPRLAWGLTKKLLIADNLAPAVNYVHAHVFGLHGAPLWMAFYLFPLQIYADFSGLTDIAISAGRLFGVSGPENFNRPFTASSISDFWRRWHMSLTTWLTDYLFTPLYMAMRATGKLGLACSIAINMEAVALWHGLTGGYAMFGVLNGAYLIVDALTARPRSRFFKRNPGWNAAGNFLGWLLTFHLFAIALVFFRAPRVSGAWWLLGHLFTGWAGSAAILNNILAQISARNLAVGLAGYLCLELGERYRPDLWVIRRHDSSPRWLRWSFYSAAALVLMFGLCLFVVSTGEARSPFIYEIF